MRDNAPLLIRGRISLRDEKDPQIMVDDIRPLSDISEAPQKPRPTSEEGKLGTLFIRLPSGDDPILKKIELILTMFPGREKIVIYFSDTGKRLGATCDIHEALIAELKKMLGEENVVAK